MFRRIRLPSGRNIVLSDTVGFIRDLPHTLVSTAICRLCAHSGSAQGGGLVVHAGPAHPVGRYRLLSVRFPLSLRLCSHSLRQETHRQHPAQVDAFKSTLEEMVHADLMLHVLDSSAPSMRQQRAAVLQVLHEVGVPSERMQQRMVEAWNKADKTGAGFGPLGDEDLAVADGSGVVQLARLTRPGQVAGKRNGRAAPVGGSSR